MNIEIFEGKVNLINKNFTFYFDKEKLILIKINGKDENIRFTNDENSINYIEAKKDGMNGVIAFYDSVLVDVGCIVDKYYLYPQYYLKSYMENNYVNEFDAIIFKGSIINAIYNPKNAIKEQEINVELKRKGYKIIEFKPFSDTHWECRCNIMGKEVNLSFNINRPSGLDSDYNIGKLESIFKIDFVSTQNNKDLAMWYEKIKKLFSFIFDRKDVCFDEIYTLIKNKNRYDKIADFVDINYSDEYKFDIDRNLDFNNFKVEFSKLFEFICNTNFTFPHIPLNDNSSKRISPQDYVICSGVVEKYWEEFYKEDSLSNENYCYIYDKLVEILNKIDEEEKGRNRERRKYVDSIKEVLARDKKSLMQKTKVMLNAQDKLLSLIFDKYKKHLKFNIDEFSVEISRYFAKARNRLAHGNVDDLNNPDIVAYLVVRIVLYATILKQCDFNEDDIEKIVKKLF